MAAIPAPAHTLGAAIDAAHEARREPPRGYLGASALGHPCDRWLWLSFRWAVVEEFDGRMLRLFRRGHLEEATAVADLEAAGCVVSHTGADQLRVELGGHLAGHADGIIESGVPEAPKTRHLLEIKTHSLKSIEALAKDGLRKSKPMHWAQMQVYMQGLGLDRGLYYAVCKNDDRIYTERIERDREAAKALIERGHRITTSVRMPEPLAGGGPSWYACKFCPAYAHCWERKPVERQSCRTCRFGVARSDGDWRCASWDSLIPLDAQRVGCERFAMRDDVANFDDGRGG